MRLRLLLIALAASLVLAIVASSASAITLTPGTATAAFKQRILRQSPNAKFPANEGQACPEVFNFSEGPTSLCFAEYTTNGIWNLSGGSASTERGQIVFTYPSHTTWKRHWVRCQFRGKGKLFSNHNCGQGFPESDRYFVRVELLSNIRFGHPLSPIGWQFTDSVGFDSLGRFNGKRQGHSLVFTNAVGDAFRYKP